jgi:sporulation protein YlmC with PRC-barrel domain
MEIPVNAEVKSAEGSRYGQLTYVIIDPKTRLITHLVVKADRSPHTERLVPVDRVLDSTSRVMRLRSTPAELDNLPPFIQTEYLREEIPYADVFAGQSEQPVAHLYDYTKLVPTYVPISQTQIPAGEIALQRGAQVEALDGSIGRVDEFLVDPKDEKITHLILRIGHLWGQRDITIPVDQIDRLEDERVYLKLNKQQIGQLPAVTR